MVCSQQFDDGNNESFVNICPASPGPFLSCTLVSLFGRISNETREDQTDPGMHNLEYLCGLFTPPEDVPQSLLCTPYRPTLCWTCAPEPPTMSQSSQTEVEAHTSADQRAVMEHTCSHEDLHRQPPLNMPISLSVHQSPASSQQESHPPVPSLAEEVERRHSSPSQLSNNKIYTSWGSFSMKGTKTLNIPRQPTSNGLRS